MDSGGESAPFRDRYYRPQARMDALDGRDIVGRASSGSNASPAGPNVSFSPYALPAGSPSLIAGQ